MLSDFLFRIRALVRGKTVEAELDDELRFHFERQVEKHMQSGMGREEARRRVRLEFGGLEQVKEECREARGVRLAESLAQDVRYGARMLAKSPGATAVAILSIALGLAANTTVIGWMQSILLNPWPGVDKPAELVTLETLTASKEPIDTSYKDYRDYRDQARSFAGVAVFKERPLNVGGRGKTEQVWSEMVSGNFFDVLGVKPVLGRFFLPEEQAEKQGAFPVAVISARFWKRHYGVDPRILGQTIVLNRRSFTIIGVAPENFAGTINGLSYDLWVPLMMLQPLTGNDWLDDRDSRPLHTFARLKPGVSRAQADAEAKTIAERLARDYPDSNKGIGVELRTLRNAPYGAQTVLSPMLMLLLGVGGAVLLIVCANVANLLLARAAARRKEMGVRLALGAGRGRLVRQFLTEAMLLALTGGLLGMLLSWWTIDALKWFIPPTNLPVTLHAQVNVALLCLTLALAALTGLLFGAIPALQGTRADVQHTLRDSSRSVTSGSSTHRLGRLLVVSEVALSLVALVASGLFLQSFRNAKRIDPGFDPNGVVGAGINLSTSGYSREQGLAFIHRLRALCEQIPGVESISFAEDQPLGFQGGQWETLEIAGYTPAPGENMKIFRNLTAPGYFQVMRIPLVEGRDFRDSDDEQSPPVAIVNQTFARRYFGDEHTVGRHFNTWGQDITIIGVAKDGKYRTLNEAPQPYFYAPLWQQYHSDTGLGLYIRVRGDTAVISKAIEKQVQAIDPGVSIYGPIVLAQFLGAAYFAQKIAASVLTVLAALGLLLAALGQYSVIAYAVTQRIHEIGIRMALGAHRRDIRKLVLRHGVALTVYGIVLGAAASLGVMRLLASQLFGINPGDPATFAGVAALLCVVAVLACYFPARRAMRVDPIVALRHE